MTSVCMENQFLPVAEALAEIFDLRKARVILRTDQGSGQKAGSESFEKNKNDLLQHSDVFLCSEEFAKRNGGTIGVVDIAKGIRAKKLVIVGLVDDKKFAAVEEMNGKLIRISIPMSSIKTSVANNFCLQMIATLSLDDSHIAVGDPTSNQLLALAERVASTDVTVFINGPTGTGKEVLARFIHRNSNRKDQAFVAVNCAAIPENMLEAILFGHEKGAFTGASTANKGIFRAADGGTLLLDEISEMPLSLQAKLLRVLQERKVTPIGSQREVEVDVRVLATTNRDMQAEIRGGRFREDLFYRLNVFPLATQHLRQRPDDIIPISSILILRHTPVGMRLPDLDSKAREILGSYNWPGNVRELENVLQRAIVLCSDGRITEQDIMIDGLSSEALPQHFLSKGVEPNVAAV
jgi:two-component system response regulator FlrC